MINIGSIMAGGEGSTGIEIEGKGEIVFPSIIAYVPLIIKGDQTSIKQIVIDTDEKVTLAVSSVTAVGIMSERKPEIQYNMTSAPVPVVIEKEDIEKAKNGELLNLEKNPVANVVITGNVEKLGEEKLYEIVLHAGEGYWEIVDAKDPNKLVHENEKKIKVVEGKSFADVDVPEPKADGKDFVGWSTKENGEEADRINESEIRGKTNLYAIWKDKSGTNTPSKEDLKVTSTGTVAVSGSSATITVKDDKATMAVTGASITVDNKVNLNFGNIKWTVTGSEGEVTGDWHLSGNLNALSKEVEIDTSIKLEFVPEELDKYNSLTIELKIIKER